MVAGSVRLIFFIVAHDAHSLFEQVNQRARSRSAVPQKRHGVPAHSDDNEIGAEPMQHDLRLSVIRPDRTRLPRRTLWQSHGPEPTKAAGLVAPDRGTTYVGNYSAGCRIAIP